MDMIEHTAYLHWDATICFNDTANILVDTGQITFTHNYPR